MQDDAPASGSLQDEAKAVLACLAHARQALKDDKLEPLDEIGLRIERYAQRIACLRPADRQGMQPLLLALLDDVDRTIEVYREELTRARTDLTSAYRGRAAGAAYRQVKKY